MRLDRDRGLSLVELVVSMTLAAMLAGGAAAALTAAQRAMPVADASTDEARTMQGVVTWLPQDVDSTPPGGFDLDPNRASGCTQSPGTNLLHLQWAENPGGVSTTYIANYRYVDVGSAARIQRVVCSGIGAGPYTNTVVVSASTDLPRLPADWTQGSLPVRVQLLSLDGDPLVRFEVQTLDGAIVSTDAAPKNPSETLVPTTTTVVGTTVPATTTTAPPATTTTTTTDPMASTTTAPATTTTIAATTTTVAPCTITSVALNPTSVKNTAANGNGKSSTNVGVLAAPVTITLGTSGDCTGLEARAATGAPNGELFRNFTKSGTSYSVTFPGYPQGSSELWADGFRTISFYTPTGGPYAQTSLQVK
jgi:prepilin-type N-terminal cleavage/methylation domain-containing protein